MWCEEGEGRCDVRREGREVWCEERGKGRCDVRMEGGRCGVRKERGGVM